MPLRRTVILLFLVASARLAFSVTRPFIFVLDQRDTSISIAKIDSRDYSVSCRSAPIPGTSVPVWGITGTADGSRIFIAVPNDQGNGSIAVLNGNDCSVAVTPNPPLACQRPNVVAAYADGSRIMVACAGQPGSTVPGKVLHYDAAFNLLDSLTLSTGCEPTDGGDLQQLNCNCPNSSCFANLRLSCQGTAGAGGGVHWVSANCSNLFPGFYLSPSTLGCTAHSSLRWMRDVAVASPTITGDPHLAAICLSPDNKIIECQNDQCSIKQSCPTDGEPIAVAHEQIGTVDSKRVWVVDAGVKVWRRDLGGCSFTPVDVGFHPRIVATNPATKNTAYVVGFDACNGGAIAEVNREGTILSGRAGLPFYPHDNSADSIFVAMM